MFVYKLVVITRWSCLDWLNARTDDLCDHPDFSSCYWILGQKTWAWMNVIDKLNDGNRLCEGSSCINTIGRISIKNQIFRPSISSAGTWPIGLTSLYSEECCSPPFFTRWIGIISTSIPAMFSAILTLQLQEDLKYVYNLAFSFILCSNSFSTKIITELKSQVCIGKHECNLFSADISQNRFTYPQLQNWK